MVNIKSNGPSEMRKVAEQSHDKSGDNTQYTCETDGENIGGFDWLHVEADDFHRPKYFRRTEIPPATTLPSSCA